MTDFHPLFHAFVARHNDVHFVYDVSARRIVYVSEAYEQLTGDPAAHIDDDWPHLVACIHPDDWEHLRQQLAQVGPDQLVQDAELRLQRGQRLQWLSVTVGPVQVPEQPSYLVGAVRDITPTKEAAINAQKFNTKKDSTLQILSHDLATPLVLLQQLTEELRSTSGQVGEPVQQLLELMERTCRQGLTLIHDFVDQEFLESSNVELKWERSELVFWLGTIMEEYARSEHHTHLRFTYEAPDQPVYVLLDVNKFLQVVNNLVSNAIKFTPAGGRISLRLEARDGQAWLSVTDSGVGIPENVQPLLFDKFTKARRPGLRGEKTTGLGMSIIQTLVGLHQGHLTFESTEGLGTTFTIALPLSS
jgi:two-component system sensor histidine kinase VicK